ncbi:hypothetical protein J4456_04555 [Candidatus Pacearchaeota archaeon]|nr:hypothetical protein [Candidatus Pacearchaeota archaeon]
MRYAIIYCKDNIAGKNVADRFREMGFNPHVPIIELRKETLYSEITIEKYPELRNIDFIFFASTHRSEKGVPSLCLHTPGNWRSADLGGKEGKICPTYAFVMKYLFIMLHKFAIEEKVTTKYSISMEATHHGPLIDIPCCFIELGSAENEWKDATAAGVLAKTVLSIQEYKPEKNWIASLAIGGPHYAPNFNHLQLKSSYAVSHIVAQYSLPLTENMLKEAEAKTKEQISKVLIDWKGCGKAEERERMITLIDKMGFSYLKTSDV